jgi:hypothetical protein
MLVSNDRLKQLVRHRALQWFESLAFGRMSNNNDNVAVSAGLSPLMFNCNNFEYLTLQQSTTNA